MRPFGFRPFGLGNTRRPGRRAGASGPATPQAQAYDFTGALPAAFEAAWSGPSSYAAGYPAYEDMASRAIAAPIASSKIIRRDSRGLRLEPAATNLATNSRMLGSTAAVPLATPLAGLTIAIGSITPLTGAGSNVYRCVTPSAHGRSTGDRVIFTTVGWTCGGRTFSANNMGEYTITVVDATTFDFAHWQFAISTAANNIAVTYQYRTWTSTGTFPTGPTPAIRGDSGGTRFIRLVAQTDPSSGAVPFPIAATRTYNIAGTGTDYLMIANIAAVQGETVGFSQVGGILPRRPQNSNDQQTKFNLGIEIAFIEKTAGGAVLRETAVDIYANLPVTLAAYNRSVAAATMQDAACASVDIAYKFTGSSVCDMEVQFREYMISKSRHRASLVLPAWNTTGTATKALETCAGVSAPFALRGADYTFESKEIVNTTDTIISFGSVELQAVGATFPRDLVLTDGTNSVTLAGALRNLWPTQQIVRVAMSWGPGGLRISTTDDFLRAAQFGGNPTFSGAAQTVINLNEDAAGSKRGMSTAKGLKLYNTERTPAEVTAASRLTSEATFAVPGVDTPVGRTSVAVPTVPPASNTFGPGNKLVTGSGRVWVGATGSNTVYEDFDFRGFYISQNGPNITNVTFRNCIFDMSFAASLIVASVTQNNQAGCTGWIFENCDWYTNRPAGYNASPSVGSHLLLQLSGGIVQRCRFFGSVADIISVADGVTLRDNILVASNETVMGSHADAIQFLKVDNSDVVVRRVLIDFRKLYGVIIEPNFAIGGNAGAGVTNFTKQIIIEDVIAFGGFTALSLPTTAPSATTTIAGVYLDQAQHTLSNFKLGVTPNSYTDVRLDGRQLRFVGAAVTFASSGRTGAGHCLGLVAGTWADGHRAGSLKTTALAGPATLLTPLNGLATPMIAADAVTITVSGVPQTITVFNGTASGNNQINTTDTIQTFINKVQALFPALTVTLEDYRVTLANGGVRDFFTDAVLV